MKPAVMAEFETAPALVAALRALRSAGVTELDAFTPYDVRGVAEVLSVRRSWLGWIVLAAGLAGGAAAYALEWWINVVDYPINSGGRPDHAWPAFIPIAFEMAVLCAGAAALVSALVLGGLPQLWHPVFEVEGFERASIDRFWLAIGAGDPTLDRAQALLAGTGALRVVVLGGPS